jgi:prevent-host-death family protein
MEQVGIRELRQQASEILRRVREDGEQFEVTYHGQVVAKLIPAADVPDLEKIQEFWRDWERLAADISAEWPEGVSAVQAIREDRGRL